MHKRLVYLLLYYFFRHRVVLPPQFLSGSRLRMKNKFQNWHSLDLQMTCWLIPIKLLGRLESTKSFAIIICYCVCPSFVSKIFVLRLLLRSNPTSCPRWVFLKKCIFCPKVPVWSYTQSWNNLSPAYIMGCQIQRHHLFKKPHHFCNLLKHSNFHKDLFRA